MTCAERTRDGEKGADLGRALGPWTVQTSFMPLTVVVADAAVWARPWGASTSAYAEPEAAGVIPVLRTGKEVSMRFEM